MASDPARTAYGKTAPEMESAAGAGTSPPASCSRADLFLRLLLFVASLVALIVLVTSKQTKQFPVPNFPSVLVPRSAKFQNSPAFVYLLTALVITCVYSVLTLLTSAAAMRSPPPTKLLFHFVLLDTLMAVVMASATGAGGAVAYIGLKGNSHVRWSKICNVYDEFCRHIGGAVGVSLVASAALVALVAVSSYSLHRRSR